MKSLVIYIIFYNACLTTVNNTASPKKHKPVEKKSNGLKNSILYLTNRFDNLAFRVFFTGLGNHICVFLLIQYNWLTSFKIMLENNIARYMLTLTFLAGNQQILFPTDLTLH